MNDVRSMIAQYIAGEMKVDESALKNRRLPLQKKFKFEDTWITLNRKLGEALIIGSALKKKKNKSTKPSQLVCKRRNAVAVVDLSNRLMTNGLTWPSRNDWVIGVDRKIRYGPAIQPLRRISSPEWICKENCVKKKTALERSAKSRSTEVGKSSTVDLSTNKIVFGSTRITETGSDRNDESQFKSRSVNKLSKAHSQEKTKPKSEIEDIPNKGRDDTKLNHSHFGKFESPSVNHHHHFVNHHHQETSNRKYFIVTDKKADF